MCSATVQFIGGGVSIISAHTGMLRVYAKSQSHLPPQVCERMTQRNKWPDYLLSA